ncbi:MAG: recombinase family protein [Lachnospiraceae bacterium]|nr:recombinase family protein [Lachnospiraceae bacterium]
MEMSITKTFHAAIYLRLSKEDGDVASGNKQESNSISNQKELILDFLKTKPEISVVSIRTDDGYSGVNFDRPEFQRMMEDVRKGVVDCIVVKDLSRFGRNYIDAGRYIEKIFPALGVRFIAVTDNYDSYSDQGSQDIIIAFKNLINDSYLRDLSTKIRSHLAVKRKNGEFIGNFAVYGYLKEEGNRNHLIIDPFAAEIVKDIFKMKLDGMSPRTIADKLNDTHVLSPMEYKKSLGINYETSFKTSQKAMWSPNAVTRILTNRIYTGVLEQGKRTTPNYKIKSTEKVDAKEWVRVEHSHEPIIDSIYFDIVQNLLGRDTRQSQTSNETYPLCGLVFCADCGAPMVRKTNLGRVKDGQESPKRYVYYMCRNRQKSGRCTGHRIREEELLSTVFEELQSHIRNVLNMQDALEAIDMAHTQEFRVKRFMSQMEKKEEELMKAQKLKIGIYEDLKEGLIDQEEYRSFKNEFNRRIQDAEDAIRLYQEEIEKAKENKSGISDWMNYFREYKNIESLTRSVASIFINRVLVYEGRRIKIVYNFEERLADACEYLENAEKVNKAI